MRWALCLAGGIVVAGGLSLASWFLLSDGPTRAPGTIELVIPAGTAARIEAGGAPPSIPSELTFVVGDTLVLRNEDSVQQEMGPFAVPAGGTLRIPLRQASTQTFLCTFHPQGRVGLVVRGRTSPLWILWPTLLLGLPLGAAAGAVVTFLGRLEDSDEQAAVSERSPR